MEVRRAGAKSFRQVHGPQPEMTTILRAESSRERSRKSYPLDVSVGSIGITASPGSPAGGAGIMGGPMEDSSSPAQLSKLPALEGSASSFFQALSESPRSDGGVRESHEL